MYSIRNCFDQREEKEHNSICQISDPRALNHSFVLLPSALLERAQTALEPCTSTLPWQSKSSMTYLERVGLSASATDTRTLSTPSPVPFWSPWSVNISSSTRLNQFLPTSGTHPFLPNSTQRCPPTLATKNSARRTPQVTSSASTMRRLWRGIHIQTSTRSKHLGQTGLTNLNGTLPRQSNLGGS